jgi:hypothetical protein
MSNKNQVEAGSEYTFYSTDGGNNFGIAFDKIFGQDILEAYNLFEMNSKRNFKNLVPMIIETYEELFLDEGEKFVDDLAIILFDMINVKSKLMVNEATSYDVFIEMLDSITDSHDKLLIKTIDKYVEENYALDLDKITQETKDKKKKINEELQFSDKHAKTLIKIAYLYRITIPIISVYFTYNKSLFARNAEELASEDFEDYQFDEINSNVFSYLFEKFATNAAAVRNKLYKLTLSRVSKTVYSDKRFWAAAKNQGITKDTETLEIYKKLLTNAIPKLAIDKDKNIVSFFQSVIINQIDFLFQNKFKHKFLILGGGDSEKYSDDDDETSEYERLEIQMLRKDEGLFMIRKLSIKQTLKSIPGHFGVTVTDDEVKNAIKYISRHGTQEKIVSMLTFKYFEDKMAIKFLTFYEYVYLLIATKKYLEAHKFVILPQILSAHCEKHKERTNISGKRIRPLIQDSKKYRDLFAAKYSNFAEEVEKPLSAIIATTYSSVFTDNDGEELFDSTVKVGKVADELIDLAFLI